MKILFHTQYFPPEVGAPQARIYEFAVAISKQGHEVQILTAMPNYPQGRLHKNYRWRLWKVEQLTGLRIVRTWIFPTKSRNPVLKLLNYFSFMVSCIIPGIFFLKELNVVITESPPLFLGFSGWLIARMKRAKFVFNVSDLWPESAVSLGIVTNRKIIHISTWLEEFCYRKANLITAQTEGIVENIRSRFPDKRVVWIPNGADPNLFGPEHRDPFWINRWKGKFIVGYTGLMGLAQGLEVIIQTADKLKNYSEIQFVLAGDGPVLGKLKTMVSNRKLKNIEFIGLVPKEKMPGLLPCLNVAIVPLRNLSLFRGALPSKIFEILASKVPIILSIKGEAERLLKEAEAGIVVEPENPEALANAVLTLYNNRELGKKLGQNGRNYIQKNFNRQVITKCLLNELKNLLQ